jgi:hypothetical protein
MSPCRNAAGRRRAARVILALAVVSVCLGAVVAYAATRSGGKQNGLGENRVVRPPSSSGGTGPQSGDRPPKRERLLRPQLLETPPQQTEASDIQIRFRVPAHTPVTPAPAPIPASGSEPNPEVPTRRFQCKLDDEDWSGCSSPYRMTGLTPGTHRFVVRAFNREERVGEAVDSSWQQTPAAAEPTPQPPAENQPVEPGQPKQFSIEALEEPEGLYPGFPPRLIPIRVNNPNPVPIEVTALTVAIGDAPADCSGENFELTPSSASPQAPLTVPAEGSIDLPAGGIEPPAIQMLNLPVEQDACQEAAIPLVFGGEAEG